MGKLLEQGDIIQLTGEHKVYAQVPEHLVYSNRKGCFDLVTADVKLNGEFSYLQGQYLVVKTEKTGGGIWYGPHDIFPDGHKVTCKMTGGMEHIVSFYQTGAFTAMIRDIEPIGKAKLEFVMPN